MATAWPRLTDARSYRNQLRPRAPASPVYETAWGRTDQPALSESTVSHLSETAEANLLMKKLGKSRKRWEGCARKNGPWLI